MATAASRYPGRKFTVVQQYIAFAIVVGIASFVLAMTGKLTDNWVKVATMVLAAPSALAISFMGANAYVVSKGDPLVGPQGQPRAAVE